MRAKWQVTQYQLQIAKRLWLNVYTRDHDDVKWSWFIESLDASSSIARGDGFKTAPEAVKAAVAYLSENFGLTFDARLADGMD